MAQTLVQRLMELGTPFVMANELVKQINAKTYNVTRLINAGWVEDLAFYLASSLTAGTFKATKAVEYSMIPSVAILVAVGGAWEPEQLGAKIYNFWDAEKPASMSVISGAVASWTDTIGGKTVIRSTAASRPDFVATGFNGRPALVTDGIQKSIELAAPGLPQGSAPCRIYVLGESLADGANTNFLRFITWGSGGPGGDRAIGVYGVAGQSRMRALAGNGASSFTATAQTQAAGGRHLYEARMEADRITIAQDGYTEDEVAMTLAGTGNTRVRIGANAGSGGGDFIPAKINAVLITAVDLTLIETNALLSWAERRGGFTRYTFPVENVDPDLWATMDRQSQFTYNGVPYNIHTARKPWSVYTSKVHPNLLRFEVRRGDNPDSANEQYDRDELAGPRDGPQRIPRDTEHWIAFSARARGIALAGQRTITQIVNDEVEFMMVSYPNSMVFRTFFRIDGVYVQTNHGGPHPPMVDNVPEDFVIRSYLRPDGTSFLQVWRNGVQIVNSSAFSVGTGTDADNKRHKMGAYRPRVYPPFIIEIANRVYGSDLSAKISMPDAWPNIWSA